jgi:hypothetical protein
MSWEPNLPHHRHLVAVQANIYEQHRPPSLLFRRPHCFSSFFSQWIHAGRTSGALVAPAPLTSVIDPDVYSLYSYYLSGLSNHIFNYFVGSEFWNLGEREGIIFFFSDGCRLFPAPARPLKVNKKDLILQ